jgi:hypothetical protein
VIVDEESSMNQRSTFSAKGEGQSPIDGNQSMDHYLTADLNWAFLNLKSKILNHK